MSPAQAEVLEHVLGRQYEIRREELGITVTTGPWWKGSRGEWYLVVQAALFALVLFGPRSLPGRADVAAPASPLVPITATMLALLGVMLAAAGAWNLGRNLTPLPRPKEGATLVVSGAYRLVRHPVYSGLSFMAFGWALWQYSWLTAGYALLLFVFFDVKSRHEERWLTERFPEYAAYRSRVCKLIPFIY